MGARDAIAERGPVRPSIAMRGLAHAAARRLTEMVCRLRRSLYDCRTHKKAVADLMALDARMLKDIGLQRSQVQAMLMDRVRKREERCGGAVRRERDPAEECQLRDALTAASTATPQ